MSTDAKYTAVAILVGALFIALSVAYVGDLLGNKGLKVTVEGSYGKPLYMRSTVDGSLGLRNYMGPLDISTD
jgi:hypothetical protein